MEPEVRYLLPCDDVRTDPDNYQRIDILGLITTIRSTVEPPFPVARPLLCALVILTGSQGKGELLLRIFHDRSMRVVFRSSQRQVRFVGASDAVLGVVFRIRNCSFPVAGLYWVEVSSRARSSPGRRFGSRPEVHPMEPYFTITVTCDSLVEFEEDAANFAEGEPEFMDGTVPALTGKGEPGPANSSPPHLASSQEPEDKP